MIGRIIVGVVVIGAVVFLVSRKHRGNAKETPGKKDETKPDGEKPLLDIAKDLLGKFKEILSNELSYEEAMKYFIDHKNDSPAIVKGAMLKEKGDDGLVITLVFLDNGNKLVTDSIGNPLGCKRKVKQLDDELLRLFKDRDLVIVE